MVLLLPRLMFLLFPHFLFVLPVDTFETSGVLPFATFAISHFIPLLPLLVLQLLICLLLVLLPRLAPSVSTLPRPQCFARADAAQLGGISSQSRGVA